MGKEGEHNGDRRQRNWTM